MPRQCTICHHSERNAIDSALITSEGLRDVAGRFRISKTSLHQHKMDHLPATLIKAAEIRDVVDAGSLLERLKSLNAETRAILREARQEGSKDNELALKAIGRIERQLELEGRLIGELHEASVNIAIGGGGEWDRIRAVVLTALEGFPGAKLHLEGALKNAKL